MRTLLAAFLMTASAVLAEETVTAITATAWSYHLKRNPSDCEFNPGLGLEHGRRLRAHFGVFNNSDCNFGGYAGFSLTERVTERWRAGAAVLGFSGYHKEKKKPDGTTERTDKMILAPMLVLAYEGKKRGLNIGFIPGENMLRKLGIADGKDGKDDEFKGLLFLQFKVLKW